MIGLALAAKDLALKRADADHPSGIWGAEWFRAVWIPQSRAHGRYFPHSPTAHYHRIIDNISAGRKP